MIINDEYRRDGHSSAQAQRHFGPGGTGMSRASARAPTGSCGTQLMTAPSSFTTWSVNWLMSCGAWAETVRKLVMHGPGGGWRSVGKGRSAMDRLLDMRRTT